MAVQFNTALLNQNLSKTEIQKYKASYKPKHLFTSIMAYNFFPLLIAIVIPLGIISLSVVPKEHRSLGNAAIFCVAAIIIFFIVRLRDKKDFVKAAKVEKFAANNQLDFKYAIKNPPFNGLIFARGRNRVAKYILVSKNTAEIPFTIGNYRYTTGHGRYQQDNRCGFIEIKLDRKIPQLVLDAKQNNMWKTSNLPNFSTSQKLELEGNFNKYFTLYCPKNYEQDALYILTPDVMALLIDRSATYDLEIVDNNLYIYASSYFDLTNPLIVRHIQNIINALGAKVSANTKYYADERVANRQINIVAEPGRRLKTSVSWIGVILFILYLVYLTVGAFHSWG